MGKANYRKDNMCVLCENWLGKSPDTDHATLQAKFSGEKGMCKCDGRMHSPDEICRQYEKNMLYL